ncbi:hypothetical protein ES703_68358 [subsurface metagenome]
MEECFKCGVSEDKAWLFDAIGEKGVVKICKKCSSEENMPIIRKPTNSQLEKANQKQTVYERLSHAAGIDKKDYVPSRPVVPSKQETTLRNIVDKNLKIKVKGAKPRGDLIHNFHWIIMRVRRSKHISQKQLAEAIGEPEQAIKMAEQGIIPENNYQLVNKLENYFRIRLVKEDKKESLSIQKNLTQIKEDESETEQNVIGFDPITTKSLTISDLKEMKKKREEEILSPQEQTDSSEFEEESEVKEEDINFYDLDKEEESSEEKF